MSFRRPSESNHAKKRQQRDPGEPGNGVRANWSARPHLYSAFSSISSRIIGSNDAWLG